MSASDPVNRDRWARVNDLFHRALELAPEARAAFVHGAGDEPTVKQEVLSLLEAHARAGSFIETPAGTIEASSAEVAPPSRIGGYEIRGVLGEGGMGVVYLAEDVRLGRTVALKALAPRFVGDAARRERLRREARAAASLNHPGIATVFALEEIDGHLYIAGEYVAGETLRDELSRGPLEPVRAVSTVLAVARALIVAHERGIVHRDLKPENLIRTPAGEMKILDFGIARMHDPTLGSATLTAEHAGLGTPAYMAPEQIRGEAVDARADIFSLGVVLYEALTGVRPFAGSDAASTIAKILEAEPARLRDQAPALTSLPTLGHVEHIVLTCLRKRPADRFPSARDLVAALDEAREATGHPHHANRPALPPAEIGSSRAVWWWRFHQAAATVGYALLLIPLWRLRDMSDQLGTALFVAGLIGATTAGAVRLHSWFIAMLDHAAWRAEHRRSAPWRVAGDVLMTTVLAAEGVLALLAREAWGMLLVTAAVAVLVSFVVIEPATTRAAFRQQDS